MNRIFELEYRKLNPKQKEAVDAIEGPVMVIAGPGTGKTQILAMRIANILKVSQVNPSNILALTFTNSGVYQMKKRLLEIIGPASYNIHVHTFHSFCNEVINTFPDKFMMAKEINQLTDLEQILIIHDILDQGEFENLRPLKSPHYYDKAIIKAIGDLKQENVLPQDFKKVLEKTDLKNSELVEIYEAYQAKLQCLGAYDYADMILFVLDALKKDLELLAYYQEKFQYILLDEYQDTNYAQNEIAKILAGSSEAPNIFVVGDDEQSIFRFQGASIENILFFTQTYPNAKIVVLTDNYRSTQKILDASRAMISQNKNQIFNRLKVSKNLKSHLAEDGKIQLGHFATGSVENFFVAKEIKRLIQKGQRPSEIAVIYREHRDSVELVGLLSRLNVPYKIEAGANVLDDPEITKIIHLLSAVNDPNNDQILLEIMHYPFFELPIIDTYRLTNLAGKNQTHIFENLVADDLKLKLFKPATVKKFVAKIFACQAYLHNHTLADVFDYIINETGYLKYLLRLDDAAHHLNRLQALFSEIKQLNLKDKEASIQTFLDHMEALKTNSLEIVAEELDASFEGVRLMTAHKAKGMEFETVFLIHLTDKHWGNVVKRRLIKLPKDLIKLQEVSDSNDEEERRLFYVGLTRAKKNIYLSYSDNYGENSETSLNVPTKFLAELPEKNIDNIDVTKFDKQYEERLKLTFSQKKWHKSKALKSFIDELIENFTLSATSLNAYLECPRSFFLNQLLRVPKVKDFLQSYGTAVHYALEKFFKLYVRELKLPPKQELIEFFNEGLDREILTKTDRARAEKQGSEVLKKYYDYYGSAWKNQGPPLSCEYNFRYHRVKFGKIPISGIIDKIEFTDTTANKVKVVDYKTSSPKSLNQLLGKTKEARVDELHQAYFYKLLAENDPLFRWQFDQVQFDFVSPRNGKFYRTELTINSAEFEKFKILVRETYQKILRQEFSENPKSCRRHNFRCEYFELCE